MKLLDTWVGTDQAWSEARLREGWGGLIQGAGSGGHASPLYPHMQAYAEGSLRGMRLAGGLTAAYLNANPWYSATTTYSDAMRAIGSELEYLNFIAIDFELRPEPADHEGGRAMMEHTNALIRLVRDGIHPNTKIIGYSADWFLGFFKTLGWTGEFPLDGYWYAQYDGSSVLGTPQWRMSSPIVGKQYMNDTYFGGKVVDLNVFDDDFIFSSLVDPEPGPLPTTDPIEEDDMKLVHVRHPASGHVYHVDVNRGYLVHDLNPTVFNGGGSSWDDVIDLDPDDADHVAIMALPVLYPKGLAHTVAALGG